MTATIIPVLYLAMVYQAKIFDLLSRGEFAALLNAFTLLLWPVLGATAALHVLATGHPTAQAKSDITIGLVGSAMVLVAIPVAVPFLAGHQAAHGSVRWRDVGALSVMLAILAAAALRAAGVWS